MIRIATVRTCISLALLTAACRGPGDGCSDEHCGGSGGAEGDPTAAEGGAGATAPPDDAGTTAPDDDAGTLPPDDGATPPEDPEACSADAECDDGEACNGEEFCDGTCRAGEAVTCADGTVCVGRDGEAACEYAKASPWLLYVGNDRVTSFAGLFGIRLDAIGESDPLDLSPESASDEFESVGFYAWSPDGRYVVADFLRAPEYTNRMYWLALGPGVPGRLEPIPDLPIIGSFGEPKWTPDSSAVVVSSRGEVYRVDFRSGAPVPALVATFTEDVSVHPCANPDHVVVSTGFDHYVATVSSEQAPELLGEGDVHVSSDGNALLFVPSDGTEAWYAACEAAALRYPLRGDAVAGEWSADSRYVAITTSLDDVSELTVYEASFGANDPLFSTTVSSTFDTRWSEQAASLLFVTEDAEGERWSVVSVPDATVTPLPTGVASATWNGSIVELVHEDAASGVWILRPGDTAPLHLARCEEFGVEYDAALRRAACLVRSESTTSVELLLFDLESDPVTHRDLLVPPLAGDAVSHRFTPDDRFVIVQHTVTAELTSSYLLAVPLDAAAAVQINRGDFAHAWAWQPFP